MTFVIVLGLFLLGDLLLVTENVARFLLGLLIGWSIPLDTGSTLNIGLEQNHTISKGVLRSEVGRSNV